MKAAIVKTATLTALVSSLSLLGASAHAASAPLPTFPSLAGPLTANAKPFSFDAGPVGNVFVTGVVSGVVQAQSNPVPGIASSQTDISNAQVFINKTDGLIQFSGQFGSYSLPALGVPYLKAEKMTQATYGVFSQGYMKIVPSANFNVMVGKLPTLMGAEYTFSFENMNIQRGLLWNQEQAVSRGIQANYTSGPIAVSASFNDGYYSNKYDTLSLAAIYTLDSSNIFAFSGSGHIGSESDEASFATSPYLNNGQIYNLIYTHTNGPWTIQPYLQYTHVPALPSLGLSTTSSSTAGAALLASYKFNDNVSLPVRAEYIRESGSAPILYGTDSKAWSLTVTPTYKNNLFFARAELSYVGVDTPVFGKSGTEKNQVTGLLETGFMF